VISVLWEEFAKKVGFEPGLTPKQHSHTSTKTDYQKLLCAELDTIK